MYRSLLPVFRPAAEIGLKWQSVSRTKRQSFTASHNRALASSYSVANFHDSSRLLRRQFAVSSQSEISHQSRKQSGVDVGNGRICTLSKSMRVLQDSAKFKRQSRSDRRQNISQSSTTANEELAVVLTLEFTQQKTGDRIERK